MKKTHISAIILIISVLFSFTFYHINATVTDHLYAIGTAEQNTSEDDSRIKIDSNHYQIQTPPENWYLQGIDADPAGYGTDIEVNEDNQPHIVYIGDSAGTNVLKHTYWDGTLWQTENVDQGGIGAFGDPALALDSNGYPHLSYYKSPNLYYARWDGTTWITETIGVVSQDYSFDRATDIALDSFDYPHISYNESRTVSYGTLYHVRYAFWDSSDWNYQLVDNEGGTNLSIALDDSDHPHISYNFRFPYENSQLKYAARGSIGWSFSTLDDGATCSVYESSIALSSDSQPHIVFECGNQVKYVSNEQGNWENQLVGDGQNVDLTIDNFDILHISYQYPDLQYAYLDNGSWITQTVDSSGTGNYTSITVDNNANPHLAYDGGNVLKFATSTQFTSTWQTELISAGGNPDITLDSLDDVHLSYQYSGLYYAYLNGTSWMTQTVDGSGYGNYTSITVDNNANPYIAYEGGAILKFAYYQSSNWYLQGIDANPAGYGTDIKVDGDNQPHIVYIGDSTGTNILKHAYWDGTLWQTENIDQGGIGVFGTPALDLDSNGYPHLSYYKSPNLYYARWDGTTWITETIGILSQNYSFDRATDIALDSFGYPHISYNESRTVSYGTLYHVRYTFWDGSDWNYQLVDNEGGTNLSIALDDSDRPHISYNFRFPYENSQLKYAVRSGIGWSFSTLEDGATCSVYESSIALSSDSQPHVVFECGNQVKYATGTIHDSPEDTLDLLIDTVMPVQVVEEDDLIMGKATAVKVIIRKTGNMPVNDPITVQLEYNSSFYTQFYVADSTNIYTSTYALKDNNNTYPLTFDSTEITKTVYFFSDDLTPTNSIFEVTATVDSSNTITESNESNNISASGSIPVYDTEWGLVFPNLYVHFFRTDWDDQSAFDSYFDASTDYILGTYPVAESRFTPNKSTNFVGDTNSWQYRGLDGLVSTRELKFWALSVAPLIRLAHPTADQYVTAVPADWFANNASGNAIHYKGLAYPMLNIAIVEANPVNLPTGANGSVTTAHELGHLFGLYLGCEDYDSDCDGEPDRVGDLASPGIWVDNRILIQPDSTTRDIYSFMGGYLARAEYWLNTEDFSQLFDDYRIENTNTVDLPNTNNQSILAVGTFAITGTVTLENWYTLPEGQAEALEPGPYLFEYQDTDGNILYQEDFTITYPIQGTSLDQSPFALTIPYISGTTNIVIKNGDEILAEKEVSENFPDISLATPNGGEQFTDEVEIVWSASDSDGDELSYLLFFSSDVGASWQPITSNLSETNYIWDVSALSTGTQYLIKVIATDGVNTGQDTSNMTFSIQNPVDVYLPTILND